MARGKKRAREPEHAAPVAPVEELEEEEGPGSDEEGEEEEEHEDVGQPSMEVTEAAEEDEGAEEGGEAGEGEEEEGEDGNDESGSDYTEDEEDDGEDRAEVKRKMKLKNVVEGAARQPAVKYDGSYRNKQRVLAFCSRGVTARYRHLLEDLRKLIPHHKREVKLDAKGEWIGGSLLA
jgi:ribosome biogenesis protein BRX1